MIDTDTKQRLINRTVNTILRNKGQLSYDLMKSVYEGNVDWPEELIAVFCLEASTITHNIPIGSGSALILREYNTCQFGSDVFRLTHEEEEMLKTISSNEGFNRYRQYGNFTIGKLFYRDNTHSMLKSGRGSRLCDFIDEYGNKIEVKHNSFKNGSPSGLHDAEYLLDIGDYTSCLYRIHNGKVFPKDAPLAIYDRLLPPRKHATKININSELMQIINNGDWIPEIEKKLKELGFKWNP